MSNEARSRFSLREGMRTVSAIRHPHRRLDKHLHRPAGLGVRRHPGDSIPPVGARHGHIADVIGLNPNSGNRFAGVLIRCTTPTNGRLGGLRNHGTSANRNTCALSAAKQEQVTIDRPFGCGFARWADWLLPNLASRFRRLQIGATRCGAGRCRDPNCPFWSVTARGSIAIVNLCRRTSCPISFPRDPGRDRCTHASHCDRSFPPPGIRTSSPIRGSPQLACLPGRHFPAMGACPA